MTYLTGGGQTRSRTFLIAGFALAVLALLAPAIGEAAKKNKKGAKVTVMSRNIYLGADLSPAINASSLGEAVDGGGEILNEVDRTDFPARAVPLAKEIARRKPDLVGLQEVALWRVQTPADYTATPATKVRYDFLALLQAQLKKAGEPYEVVVSQDEFDEELPADTDGDDSTGNPGLFGADLDGRLTMRDVILVRKDSKVKLGETDMGQFENRYEVLLGGAVPISVERGWVSVETRLKRSKFRFVNTHLEAFGDPAIKAAQAEELFATGGPLRTGKQLILVGDLNSGNARDNVGVKGGSGRNADQDAFKALKGFGMVNKGRRQTCCYPSGLTDPSYIFDHTVDHVMVKPRIRQLRSWVTGDDAAKRTPSGLWPSDHGGVVSKLQLKR